MPLRRLLAVGLWVVVTASATAIVWAGTSTVAADLTDRPPPVVAHDDVVSALQPGASDGETAPGLTTPPTSTPTSTVPADGPDPAPVPPQTKEPAPPPILQPGVAPTVPPSAPPVTQPVSPPTTQSPSRPTATYSTTGGVLTVACNGSFFIELLSATPSNGYAVNVVTAGPYYVEVHFVRAGRDDPIWAFCLGQPVRAYGGPPQGGQAPGAP
ncbi:MAG: hypothetical protein ABR540_03455 [Acidimicrobiales bacterium]